MKTQRFNIRIFAWVLITLYTFILPDAILVYRKTVDLFGQATAGKVPLVAALVLGGMYVVIVFRQRKDWRNLLYLVPCGLITFAIFTLEPNPNKHIHIPEYVLMAWLLYWVLSKDIKGWQILVLVFLYSSLLGVTDELEQGFHPGRFYGASDMLVNASSSLIGVFTILGLTRQGKCRWGWLKELKKMKWLTCLAGIELILTGLMCLYLFRVQADDEFWGIYPTWLWAGNVIFLLLTFTGLIGYYKRLYHEKKRKAAKQVAAALREARLWVVPLMVILSYMQILVVYVSVFGVEFR
jgi:VanZ family protein